MTDRDKAWQMMKDLDICMLVTSGERGLHARPMSAIVQPEKGLIWFLTDSPSVKDEEIAHQPDVCLAFSDGKTQFVSLTGYATLTDDRAAIKDLWSTDAEAFWPDGPENSRVIAIQVEPISAEVWEGQGGLTAAIKIAFSAATGSRPDLGRNTKIELAK